MKSHKDLDVWNLALLPDAVFAGGTASALYADHRMSKAADRVLTDLRSRFDDVLADMVKALRSFDSLYPQESGESPTQQLQLQLSNPLPYDLEEVRLSA